MEERALETLKVILKNRGVVANAYDPVGNPMEETHMFTYGDVLIVFSEKTRVTEREFNNMLKYASENSYEHGMVIITPTHPSESVLTVLRRYITNPENPLVQLFELRHLQFDISAHRKVPKHRLLTNEETNAVLKEFNAKSAAQFPRIDCQDPMARWMGARPNDVLEITGLCESSGVGRRYRVCVENAADA
jgi:DNA-directed RNA polymerase subunit H (RpoH/RPB5)